MKTLHRLACCALLTGAVSAHAQPRFDSTRVQALDALLQRAVDSGSIAGAVGLVLVDGRVVYERAVGWSDREARRPMRSDALFRIASQTKALTSVGIMQLIEAGQLSLDDPVSRWIPGYARTVVASRTDSTAAPTPAARPITIRMLLTHTAGLSYGTEPTIAGRYAAADLGPRAGYGWYTADKREPICATIDRLSTLPLIAQPGERYVYGYNTDVLGCVIERVSGLPLDRYLQERITGPLGMRETWFYPPPAQRERVTTVYATDSTGRLVRAPAGARGQGDYLDGPRMSFSGGAGLVSTARDYARFLECIRNDGVLDGVRILSPNAARLLHTNMVGTRYGPIEGMGYGLAFETTERFGAHGLLNEGSYGWGGAYGSWYRVDPTTHAVMVFMQQTLPGGADVRGRFGQVVQQALSARP
jgi:CubicO group peptidase (beta-lactamase class C family)